MDHVPDGAERSDMMVTALSFKEEESQAAKWRREQAERYGARFAEQLPERLPYLTVKTSLDLWRFVGTPCSSLFCSKPDG